MLEDALLDLLGLHMPALNSFFIDCILVCHDWPPSAVEASPFSTSHS